jgi:hypothetical protein
MHSAGSGAPVGKLNRRCRRGERTQEIVTQMADMRKLMDESKELFRRIEFRRIE